jgi:hypothetical protein
MPIEPLNYEHHPVRCSKCDRACLVTGVLSGEQRVGFYPKKYRKKFPLVASVDVNAVACAFCGHVEMRVDPAKLKKLAADVDPNAA